MSLDKCTRHTDFYIFPGQIILLMSIFIVSESTNSKKTIARTYSTDGPTGGGGEEQAEDK